MRKVFTALLVLAAILLTGCGLAQKATEKAIEKASGISVDEKNGTVTVQGQNGEKVTVTTEPDGKLPEGFPLPVFPGSKVKSGGKITSNAKASYTVELTYKGECAPAVEFYEKALKDKGFGDLFKAESSTEEDETWTLSGKNDKASAIFFFQSMKKTKEATIAITWGEE
jgi:predicted small lipoprotein YifL